MSPTPSDLSILLRSVVNQTNGTTNSDFKLVYSLSSRIVCAFPLSGQYGPLVRRLLYPLVVLSLLYETFPLVAENALYTVLIYVSLTAIHLSMFFLHSFYLYIRPFSKGGLFHDLGLLLRSSRGISDVGIVWPIVDTDQYAAFWICAMTTCIAAPLLAVQLHKRGSARRWSALHVFGTAAIMVLVLLFVTLQEWRHASLSALALQQANLTLKSHNLTAKLNATAEELLHLWQSSQECPTDPSISQFLRSSQSAAPLLLPKILASPWCWRLVLSLVYIIVAGCWILFWWYRHLIVHYHARWLAGGPLQKSLVLYGPPLVAMAVFTTVMEVTLSPLPTGEGSDAVGQWGPTVAFGFAILIPVINLLGKEGVEDGGAATGTSIEMKPVSHPVKPKKRDPPCISPPLVALGRRSEEMPRPSEVECLRRTQSI